MLSRPETSPKETGRLEAFSDGVFAIAITLLILEIKVPHDIEEGHLTEALLRQWPSFLAYINSFLIILVMWINHHRLFSHIQRVDTWLFIANGLLLMVITFIPYPTSVLADYLQTNNQETAVVFYSMTFFVMTIFFNVLWYSAAFHNRLLDPNADRNKVRAITQQYYIGPPLFLAAVILAFFFPIGSLILNIVLSIFFAIPGRDNSSLLPGSSKTSI